MTTAWIIVGVLWWVTGMAAFVWAWTWKHDFTSSDISVAIISGVYGPLGWLLGWFLLIREPRRTPLLRRRGPEW